MSPTIDNVVTNASATNNNPLSALDASSRPNSRRRVVLAEKKTNTEAQYEAGENGVVHDKMVVNGKDLRHNIKGELLLEKSTELFQVRKGLPASTASPRRKKALHRPERPRWQTILNIVTKNFLLLAALLWAIQTVSNWIDRSGSGTHAPLPILDYDDRISEVEASLKKAAKLLQIQLDVVDEKIGSEIRSIRRELTKQFEEKGDLLDNEVKRLEARADSLDRLVHTLKDANFLTADEFESFWHELKMKSENLDRGNNEVNLDEIRAVARSIVRLEIEKHAADGLGMVDYALASGGARVLGHSVPFVRGKAWFVYVKGRNSVHSNAKKMLEPSFGEPGNCFPLQGSHGYVDIRLRMAIVPEAVTLEHVAKSVAYDRSSAPKECRVFGWHETPDADSSKIVENMIPLVEFSYDLNKNHVQTFAIEPGTPRVINTVRFEFISNHGSPDFTCIYRFRVHGHQPSAALSTLNA